MYEIVTQSEKKKSTEQGLQMHLKATKKTFLFYGIQYLNKHINLI